jgi:hypothetical protein
VTPCEGESRFSQHSRKIPASAANPGISVQVEAHKSRVPDVKVRPATFICYPHAGRRRLAMKSFKKQGVCHSAAAENSIGSASSAFARRPSPNKSVTFVSAFSAFRSVSKYGAVKLFESLGRAGGLPMESTSAMPFFGKSAQLRHPIWQSSAKDLLRFSNYRFGFTKGGPIY